MGLGGYLAARGALVGLAGPVAPQQRHLQVVERVDVGQPQTDRVRQARAGFQQRALAGDPEHRVVGQGPFGAQPLERVLGFQILGAERSLGDARLFQLPDHVVDRPRGRRDCRGARRAALRPRGRLPGK